MTRKFTNGHPQRLPAFNFFSQYYFYNIFFFTKVLKWRWFFAFDRCVRLGARVQAHSIYACAHFFSGFRPRRKPLYENREPLRRRDGCPYRKHGQRSGSGAEAES